MQLPERTDLMQKANMKLAERTDLMQKAPLNSRRRIYIRREGLNGGSKPKIY